MNKQILSVESKKEPVDHEFHNQPDDPNNPNEVREKFEREVIEEGKIPNPGSNENTRGKS